MKWGGSGFVMIFYLCCFSMVAHGEEYMKYKDPKKKVDVRVKDLMKRMTLAEKIGQMAQLERTAVTPEFLKEYSIGSLLSGGGSTPSPKSTPEDWIEMVNWFQRGSLSSCLGIPMIYGIDAVHGHNNVYQATLFPQMFNTRDPELVKKIGAATALEVRVTGINYAFAPCIAIVMNRFAETQDGERCYERYSEDPSLVRSMTEIIPGLQGDIPSGSRKGVPYLGGK